MVERKVPLPTRWVRGFAEAQAASAGLVERHRLSVSQARQFLVRLPATSPGRSVLYAVPARDGLRLTASPGLGAVPLGGVSRLRVIEPMLRHAVGVSLWGPEEPGPGVSAWQVDLADGRLTLTLSPMSMRGFSGEGGLLFDLADDQAADDALLVSALLSWEPVIDPAGLARSAGLTTGRVLGALAHLAAAGQVGFDAAEGAYFARVLPWDRTQLESMHPRLAGARALVEAGAVHGGGAQFEVRGGSAVHLVRRDAAGLVCTCPWYAQHQRSRGPCRHILAVQILERRSP